MAEETQCLVVTINEDYVRELRRHPAVEESEPRVYFIADNKVVGEGRITTWYGVEIVVEPDEETTKTLFADDYALPLLGRVENLRYNRFDGQWMPGFSDEPEDRHKGTTVVGKMAFDLGIAPKRLAGVEGYGK